MPAPDNPQQLHMKRAYRSCGAWLVLLSVLATGLAVDLGSKAWTFARVAGRPVSLDRRELVVNPSYDPIPPHPGIRALPWRLLELQLVRNHGAVFGIGAEQRFFIINFTLAALVGGLLVFGCFTADRHALAHVAIGLILAGGSGNLHDRVVYGVVRDFLHMLPGYQLPFGWTWPGGSPDLFPWVFNLADVMLLTGMALLLAHMSRMDKRRRNQAEASQALTLET